MISDHAAPVGAPVGNMSSHKYPQWDRSLLGSSGYNRLENHEFLFSYPPIPAPSGAFYEQKKKKRKINI